LNEAEASGAKPLWLISEQGLAAWLEVQPLAVRSWVRSHGFQAEKNRLIVIPAPGGDGIAGAALGLGPTPDLFEPTLWTSVGLPDRLPPGRYRFTGTFSAVAATHLTLGWEYGSYRFTRYRKSSIELPSLVAPTGTDLEYVRLANEALSEARDLINTPANDMGPEELAAAAQALAAEFGASFACTIGEDLLTQNFPLVHAVGMASDRAPRLIDIGWGDPAHPKVTLVGKGVCFDTGGLDLKPSSGMLIMKKDMGGAANVLALARMVMDAKLKVRLRVLIPAVENAVSSNAFRPLDIFTSRKGITVEIGNTDAEGRLVLADALALADEEKPDLLIDLGTLTGAARVALGPDLPPFYTNDETLAADVARCAAKENDPLWRMPLWPPYDAWLDSKTATITNAPSGGFAGSIICALFLQRFVEQAKSWLHVDIYGWTPSAKPARPEGGECQAARAIYTLLSERYA